MRWTNEIKRKCIQIVAFGFSNCHVTNFADGSLYQGSWKQFCNPGMNCYSCPAASLSCPIGAMQAVSGSIQFRFSFYVAGFVLAMGVLLGRWICGFLCPFGLMQELLHRVPFPKKRLWKGFTYVKYVLLVCFVLLFPVIFADRLGIGKPWYCQYICPVGILEGGIPLMLTHPELRQVAGALFSWKMFLLVGTLAGCLCVQRFFCKVLCPLGAIYGILNKISLYHMQWEEETCIHCGICERVCPMDVDPVKNPNHSECIRCGACVQSCPRQSLALQWKKGRKKR